MKRKLLCVLLSTAMISTMISGCGSVTTTDESGNAQSSAAVAATMGKAKLVGLDKQIVDHTSSDGTMTPKPTVIQLLPVEPKS